MALLSVDAPLREKTIRSFKVGDTVELSGVLFTARDSVHRWLHDGHEPPVDLNGSVIYHCGPVVLKKAGRWVVTAAGPTTSMREEPYQADLIERFGLRAVIGKGGMGEKTLQACRAFGCVYFHAVGGAAQVLADRIVEVEAVHGLQQFGSTEAIWQLRVERFPVVVTMDAHGNSLHREIEAASAERLRKIIGSVG